MLLFLSVFVSTATAVQAAPKVVITIQPVGSLVAEVMRGVGMPHYLLPLGASPHSYALKPSDAEALSEADIVFWIAPQLEVFLKRPLKTLAGDARQVALIEAPDLILYDYRGEHDHHDRGHDHDDHDTHDDHASNEHDPHIWLDPRNAVAMTRHIAAVLARHDPENAALYRANADSAIASLAVLETQISESLAPYAGRRFVTFHDAYQYFEKRFGVESAGVIALNPEVQPGARRIRELMHQIEEGGADCIFFEPQFNGRVAHGLSEATGVPFAVLDPMGPFAPAGLGQYRLTLKDMVDSIRQCLSEK